MIRIDAVIAAALAVFFCIYPAMRSAFSILDPALRGPGIPKSAWRLYRNLTPRYEHWALSRVQEGKAAQLSIHNISGTEWPLFGSVFYLWAVENLQSAWEAGDHTGGKEPRLFARNAIIAASELVIDPAHASWVKQHWGTNYLHHENVFYRMLVIAALTSRAQLLHDGAHLDLLRDQVESFASELDSSKTGLLEDYPGECYPGDVLTAIMCIKRADVVLKTDHSAFIERSLRGFTGKSAARLGLVPYAANAGNGLPLTEARGCGNSYVCLAAPEMWPDQAERWYNAYDEYFWQERLTAVGYREFAKDVPRTEWLMDVDAGPVIAGHGISACAFGVGAARRNGRFDRAYPLAAEMLTTAWELPNGVLAGPRFLSNFADAPMLGEAAILSQLTVQPQAGFAVKKGGAVPPFTYIVITLALLFGAWRIAIALRAFHTANRGPEPVAWRPRLQAGIWMCLVFGGTVALWTRLWWVGFLMILVAPLFPFTKKRSSRISEPEAPIPDSAR